MSCSERLILFVCTGNTCRSPMAEGLMRKACRKFHGIEIVSAGTSAIEGMPASPEAIKILGRYQIDLSEHRSQPVDIELVEQAEIILCMTRSHRDLLLDYFPEFKEKIHLVMEFTGKSAYPGKGDVPDPFGCGMGAYQQCCNAIAEAIPGIMAYLRLG